MHAQAPLVLLVKSQYQESLPIGSQLVGKLYSIEETKVYNHDVRYPGPLRRSSRGWLISSMYNRLRRHRRDSLELLNPCTEKITEIPKDTRVGYWKVTLSCDPTTNPNDFVVGALSNFDHGDRLRDKFHNGLLYGLNENGRVVAFDCGSSNHDDDQLVPTIIVPGDDRTPLWLPCLVEASNGDLLLVECHYRVWIGNSSRGKHRTRPALTVLRNSVGNKFRSWKTGIPYFSSYYGF
ncbi:OLC1v1038766C1 [Oldenlandia corymbosa var. corymbosa]|nr:OLC1v1038766C1 [Oldenlandia corymbosa var. corymbosa]